MQLHGYSIPKPHSTLLMAARAALALSRRGGGRLALTSVIPAAGLGWEPVTQPGLPPPPISGTERSLWLLRAALCLLPRPAAHRSPPAFQCHRRVRPPPALRPADKHTSLSAHAQRIVEVFQERPVEVPFARKKGAAQTRENLPIHYVQLMLWLAYKEPCSL